MVWYDQRCEFQPFLSDLVGDDKINQPGILYTFKLNEDSVHFISFNGSFFKIRLAVEDLVCGNQPEPLIIYMPGVSRQQKSSPLMELELGGCCYEPSLKRQARNILKEKGFDDGHIDELLSSDNLSYADVVQYIDQGDSDDVQPSMLNVIFGVQSNDAIVAAWLASASHDEKISEKSALAGLYKLIEARLGIPLASSTSCAEARNKACRVLLVDEFRTDLQCAPPKSVAMIEAIEGADKKAFAKLVIRNLRSDFPIEYIQISDTLQKELKLAEAGLPAESLGSVDTFRFEEQALLNHCDELVIKGLYEDVLKIAGDRENSFWVDRQIERKAQWQACRTMAELGRLIRTVTPEVAGMGGKPEKWVEAYSRNDGWFLMDQLHRQLEALVAKLDEEPALQWALNAIEQTYDAVIQDMTVGFTTALQNAQWQVTGFTRQTEIYEKEVATTPGTTAYFWVDALRYEMGDELAKQLEGSGEIMLRPATAALPSSTKVGMAALLPDAERSFDVVCEKDKMASRIEGSVLMDHTARRKFLKARQPQLVEMDMNDLLQMSGKKLQGKVTGAPFLLVRSQEIDSLGEGASDFLARQVMDTVIGNVARAVRKLAALGVEHFVIAADHGHLFSREKGDDMKIESPGGKVIELHRRFWAGQGGSVPVGAIKVSGCELGYDSTLDFMFPVGSGVFKAGGSLSYHHGGVSLQEMVIPLLTIRVPHVKEKPSIRKSLIVSGVPEALTTRTMGIVVEIEQEELLDIIDSGPLTIRPLLVSGGKEVGRAGMAVDGEFDAATGCVTIKPDKKVMIGMLLSEEPERVQVVILDPQTDAVLGQSEEIEVKLGI
ncbi:MAG: PglZ domain-containing protein [Syntrophales bacterium]